MTGFCGTEGSAAWRNGYFAPCLLDPLLASLPLIYISIFGLLRIRYLRKLALDTGPPWRTQYVLCLILACVSVATIVSEAFEHRLFAFAALADGLSFLTWVLASCIVSVEGGRLVAPKDEGVTLPAFYVFSALVSMFRLASVITWSVQYGADKERVELSMVIVTTVANSLLACIGVIKWFSAKKRLQLYSSLNSDVESPLMEQSPAPPTPSSKTEKKTFVEKLRAVYKNYKESSLPRMKSNMARIREMLPYVWPSGKVRQHSPPSLSPSSLLLLYMCSIYLSIYLF
mmetsp:Transcript_13791/g.23046  ORF Transcript_13791/g.23046 Transcript_13791/m.23046 type:complete len:286 (+) Transcript_13791:73-930(+)